MTAEAVDAALQQARMYLDVDNHQRAREVLAHALSMAPESSTASVRRALAIGAASAVHIVDEGGVEK